MPACAQHVAGARSRRRCSSCVPDVQQKIDRAPRPARAARRACCRRRRSARWPTATRSGPGAVPGHDGRGAAPERRSADQAAGGGAAARSARAALRERCRTRSRRKSRSSTTGANAASEQIEATVISTQRAILASLLVGLILALSSGYLLIHAINRSIAKLMSAVAVTRTGNQQQLSTANEIAATTSEIGATSQEISATSKELVGDDERSVDGGRTIGGARGQRAGRPHAHGRHHAAGRWSRRLDQRQARRAQRKGGQHQPGRHDHHQGRRPDQPALAQRRHRSREGRRIRPRLRRRRDRDPPPRRPDRRGDLRHRADGQGNPVGRRRPA